MCSMTTGV